MSRRKGQRGTKSYHYTPYQYTSYQSVLPTSSALDDLSYVRALEDERTYLQEYEDRREYHPEGRYRPAGVIGSRMARNLVTVGPVARPSLAFMQRDYVLACIRRRARREVMFALNLRKKGAGAGSRKRNRFSDISC